MSSTDTTQSHIDTQRGQAFPYRFGIDYVRQNVVIYNTVENKVMSVAPSDIQRKAADPTLDPHRHALYQAAWEFWKGQP